ncbi:FecR family protein [Tepidicaulis sp. LMO-SS28]|uniref:FecR family protein n=1 Tax=Tepidicaulis sp. LMO-SS28 TaxID=3447455 RepID=UPI003EE01A94
MRETTPDTAAQAALKDEAYEWLLFATSGRATARDFEALENWCRQSAAHADAFEKVSHVWHMSAPALRRAAARDGAVEPDARQSGFFSPGRRAFLGGIAASAAAGYALIAPPMALWPSIAELSADYRTVTGERRSFKAAEDTSVELNTATSVNVRFAGNGDDRIDLLDGEAMIETARSDGPLYVAAEQTMVQALAATFSVRKAGRDVSILCVDGAVEVAAAHRTLQLEAGQRALSTAEGLAGPMVTDLELATAWRRGELIFRDEPLAAVVEEINRYRPGRIILTEAGLAGRRVSARFKLDHLDEAIAHIENAFGTSATSLPGGVILIG